MARSWKLARMVWSKKRLSSMLAAMIADLLASATAAHGATSAVPIEWNCRPRPTRLRARPWFSEMRRIE